jgi:outer membrane protein
MAHILARLTFVAICSCFAAVGQGAYAQQTANDPIFVVDMQRLLDESISGKAAQNSLKADAQKREGKLKLQRAEILRGQEELEKQSALLSPQAIEDKREQLIRKERELERSVGDERDGLARRSDEAIRKIVQDAESAVQAIAAKDKLRFVIVRDDSFVVYVDSKFDITDRVLKVLDAKAVG